MICATCSTHTSAHTRGGLRGLQHGPGASQGAQKESRLTFHGRKTLLAKPVIAGRVQLEKVGGLHERALAAVLLQAEASGHLAERAGGHAPARMQRCTSPRICTPCARALRTRRAREVNEAGAHAAAGRGEALPTCARVHAPKCAPVVTERRVRISGQTPARHPLGRARHSTRSSLVWNLAMPRAVPPQRREPA